MHTGTDAHDLRAVIPTDFRSSTKKRNSRAVRGGSPNPPNPLIPSPYGPDLICTIDFRGKFVRKICNCIERSSSSKSSLSKATGPQTNNLYRLQLSRPMIQNSSRWRTHARRLVAYSKLSNVSPALIRLLRRTSASFAS